MNNIHIGQAIRTELERQGKKIGWFCEQLCKSRSATHYMLAQPSIDTAELQRISKILKFDFFKLLSDNFEENISELCPKL